MLGAGANALVVVALLSWPGCRARFQLIVWLEVCLSIEASCPALAVARSQNMTRQALNQLSHSAALLFCSPSLESVCVGSFAPLGQLRSSEVFECLQDSCALVALMLQVSGDWLLQSEICLTGSITQPMTCSEALT